MKIKLNFTWRIWIWIIVIILSLLAISGFPPKFSQTGVLITSVESNSTAFNEGLREGQIIVGIDGKPIETLEDYSRLVQEKFISNESIKTIINTETSQVILFSNIPPEITISTIPKTNILTGLDISGGARALVKPQEGKLNSFDAEELKEVISNRLNVYGIEDVKISKISDFTGDYYVRIEIAGTTPENLRELISQQGKFEGRIGNKTVFTGGEDITSVTRSGQDAIIESCQQSTGGYFCNFRFSIFLSEEAAKRHADITGKLDINSSTGISDSLQGDDYLSERLDLFLDDNLVDSLLISSDLKGRVTTQISITGSGSGNTEAEALENSRSEMNKLQTILITGSLPYKLEIVKLDTISPSLGEEFINSILIAGLAALIAVSLFVFLRYRKFKSSLALLVTSLSEVIIILGIASLIRWNLDLPSIAGILATIGIGIDQQIIIIDEAQETSSNIRQRLKMAFAIILGAYFTAFVALVPLYWAAAGFFKGFAITTLIGITSAILITRPAFSDIIRKIES